MQDRESKAISRFMEEIKKFDDGDNDIVATAGFLKDRPFVIYGEHDEKTIDQFMNALGHPLGMSGILCADGHFGYGQPIGSAITYRGASMSGVGYDVGCGVAALNTLLSEETFERHRDEITSMITSSQITSDTPKEEFGASDRLKRVINEVIRTRLISTGLWTTEEVDRLIEEAVSQVGTIGNGNHFFNVGIDTKDSLQLVTHFGSRRLGHQITSKFYEVMGAKDSDVDPTVIPRDSKYLTPYRELVSNLSFLATESRGELLQSMFKQIRKIVGESGDLKQRDFELGGPLRYVTQSIHNTIMNIGTGDLTSYKGCCPGTGTALVASSMCDPVYVTEGRWINLRAVKSGVFTPMATPHGAGRTMSRRQAKKNITQDQMDESVRNAGITLIGSSVDESKYAYRDVHKVMSDQGLLIRDAIVPRIVMMG